MMARGSGEVLRLLLRMGREVAVGQVTLEMARKRKELAGLKFSEMHL